MNLNEQLQQAMRAGRRQGLNEQPMDIMPGTPYATPVNRPFDPELDIGPDGEVTPEYLHRFRKLLDRQLKPKPKPKPPSVRPLQGVREPGVLRPDGFGGFVRVLPDGSIVFPPDHPIYPDGTMHPGPPPYVEYPDGRIDYMGPIA